MKITFIMPYRANNIKQKVNVNSHQIVRFFFQNCENVYSPTYLRSEYSGEVRFYFAICYEATFFKSILTARNWHFIELL